MPHVIVKMWPAKSEQQKRQIADEVTKAVMVAAGYGADSVSVGIEEVQPNDWTDKVYKPDILEKPDTIFKKPGYNPL